jgi:hypothetical protein
MAIVYQGRGRIVSEEKLPRVHRPTRILLGVATIVFFLATMLSFFCAVAWAETSDERLQRIAAAATRAASGDAEASRLAREFAARAIAVTPVPGQPGVVSVTKAPGPGSVPMLFTQQITGLPASFYYEKRVPAFVFDANEQWRDWFLGAYTLFHLYHWDRHVRGLEGTNASWKQRISADERAYTMEIAAVDRLTGGKLGRTIREIGNRSDCCIRDPLSGLRMIRAERLHLLEAAWPDAPAGSSEESARRGLAAIAFVLAQRQVPQARGEALIWFFATMQRQSTALP